MRTPDRNTAIALGAIVFGMTCLSFAAVPLYRIFCQRTGFGGTTQVAIAPSTHTIEREITVFFNADVDRNLPWSFKPMQTSMKIKVGENALAYYVATNTSDKPIIGMATYNVTPDKAGLYFNKVHCFCFEEQKLLPGQRMEMPVSFFIDPAMDKDPQLAEVKSITLSYTFFEMRK